MLIDGGNANFRDTQRRHDRRWPSGASTSSAPACPAARRARSTARASCPAATASAYDESVKPIFEAIAAQVDGTPCCTYVGPDGAGHYVKMVHNGIEYADMQLIAESYDLLRNGAGLEVPQIAEHFRRWNESELESFLIEITGPGAGQDRRGDRRAAGRRDPRRRRAEGHRPLDRPERARARRPADRHHRGRVRAHAERAEGRARGGRRAAGRARARRRSGRRPAGRTTSSTPCTRRRSSPTRRASRRWRPPSDDEGWNVDLGAMATIWRGGCIIRARFLDRIREAYDRRARPGQPDAAPTSSPTRWRRRRTHGGGWSRAPPSWASRRRRSPRRWPTTTATAGRAGRPA